MRSTLTVSLASVRKNVLCTMMSWFNLKSFALGGGWEEGVNGEGEWRYL